MTKNNSQNKLNIILFVLLMVIACSKSDSADNDNVIDNQSSTLNIDKSLIQFDNTMISKSSVAATFSVQSQNLNSEISFSGDFYVWNICTWYSHHSLTITIMDVARPISHSSRHHDDCFGWYQQKNKTEP